MIHVRGDMIEEDNLMSKKNYVNYNKQMENTVSDATAETANVEETVDTEKEPAVKEAVKSTKPVYGTVTNCTLLNIREKPNTNSTVLCRVRPNSKLIIDLSNSTVDWYSVTTKDGIKGYCMKDYVVVNN